LSPLVFTCIAAGTAKCRCGFELAIMRLATASMKAKRRAAKYLREHISFDAHVDGYEGGALLVPFPEELLRLGQRLLLHEVLKGVPPCCI